MYVLSAATILFLFSSRRRHTRCLSDWSSDVCSSDLLLPGSFGEVHFRPGISGQKVTLPVNTMLFRQEGPRVAVVGNDNKVQLRPITIGRDYGSTLKILGGVDVGDQVVINPADSLEEGQQVNIAPTNRGGGNPS